MKRFIVEWRIDIETNTPEEAAKEAWSHMQRQGTTATYLDVYDENGDLIEGFDMEDYRDGNT